MRRASTAAELLLIMGIITLFVLVFVTDNKPDPSKIEQWDEVQVKETGVRGRVMSDNNRSIVKLRIDNGPGAAPRYSEVSFSRDEVTKLAEKKP